VTFQNVENFTVYFQGNMAQRKLLEIINPGSLRGNSITVATLLVGKGAFQTEMLFLRNLELIKNEASPKADLRLCARGRNLVLAKRGCSPKLGGSI
jgi:hypothetical protein